MRGRASAAHCFWLFEPQAIPHFLNHVVLRQTVRKVAGIRTNAVSTCLQS
jgi:hypothetical protein